MVQNTLQTLKGIFKLTTKIDLDFDNDSKSDGNISYSIDLLELFKGDTIKNSKFIVFDDFERCKIEIDELLGYINYYVEHLDCKVIILCNEETIGDNKQYKSFKEKVIGHTFEILPNTTDAIVQFINNFDKSLIELINENIQLIVEIFQVSEKKNLRLLKQMFTDIKRFLSLIDNSFNQNKNYNEFVKNLIAYFEIVYLEYKSGNEDIKYFQNPPFYDKELEKVSASFGAKYNPLLSEYSILLSNVVLPIHLIIEYLNNGTIDKELINRLLRNNKFFKSDKELRTWEKLWNWRYLYEDDFRKTADLLWDELINNKLESFIEVLHTIGIFLELDNENLYSKDNIIQIGKEVLDKYTNQNLNFNPATDVHIIYHPSGYEYSSRNNPEFQHLLDYTASTIKSNSFSFRDENMKEFFESLTLEKISNIYQEIKQLIPEYELTINYPILKTVDGKLFFNNLINLDYSSIYKLSEFLKFVYRPDLRYTNGKLANAQLKDLPCLERFHEELQIAIDSNKPIQTCALNTLDKVLKEIFVQFVELKQYMRDNHYYFEE